MDSCYRRTGGTVALNHAASNGYAVGAVSITSGSNAVSGAVIESCRSLTIAGMSGFIALRMRKSSGGISGAISGLTLVEGQLTVGSGDSWTGGTVALNHAASNGYAGGAVSLTSGSNAVSGAAIESCRSLAIAGVSGYIALRTG